MWLVIIFAENLNADFTYLQQQEQTEFVKVFFFITFSLSTELLEDKQSFKLGGVDTSPVYLLFQTFSLVLDSNLHDLNETNPD